VEVSADLGIQALSDALGDRPVRCFPALLSTDAEASSWARAGAAAGSVVVADYQASPRGRAGLPWKVRLGKDLGFSLVLRPDLEPEREGWPYVFASLGISDALDDARLRWPDQVETASGERLAALGVSAQLGPRCTEWVVVTVHIESVPRPRNRLLASVIQAIERRTRQDPSVVLTDYQARCVTLDEHVLARMIPLGPSGPQVAGTAVDVLDDGALVLWTARQRRVAVRPQNLGLLEPAPTEG